MRFEYDPDKSARNKIKHGIDFAQAQALWHDVNLLVAQARTDDEPRFLAIGKINGLHWSAVCVIRAEQVRIISVRRARKKERENYESE